MSEKDKGTFERAGAGVGGMAGKAADVGVDLMGSLIGGAARMLGGWWSDRSPGEAAQSFGSSEENSCRTHFNSRSSSSSRSFDEVRPLYQFGHLAGSNPDYQGKKFEDVESDLRNAWSGDNVTHYGDWDSVRDYISTGYGSATRSR